MSQLRALTSEEIAPLAARKGVRKIAVENFLCTVHANPDAYCATQNLYMDANMYKWNTATQSAIKAGITLASKPAKK
jgi:hypothetical protein